jgi:hypothetical protein
MSRDEHTHGLFMSSTSPIRKEDCLSTNRIADWATNPCASKDWDLVEVQQILE